VPASHWYSARVQSNVSQFITVQFAEQRANVLVVNQLVDPSLNIQTVGQAKDQVTTTSSTTQSLSWNLQGNGTQLVWINADSIQNSQQAAMSLQSLSGLFEVHRAGTP
jgi:hypothetical protein